MAKREPRKQRGVFERPKGSGVWWIKYFQDGVQHRECVGSKSAAADLYKIRKAAIREGRKLPDLKREKVTLSALIDDALVFARNHNRRPRDYESKAKVVKRALGTMIASSIKPKDLDGWLSKQCKTPATFNRYRAFLSLVFKQAIINDKIDSNPARLVRQRKEPPGRVRYLSDEEYGRLHDIIKVKFPQHLAEFVFSVHTGMRLSEQYTTKWSQVHLERRAIDLGKTKNYEARTVHLNQDALDASKSMKRRGQKRSDVVFPNDVKDFVTSMVSRLP